MTLHYLAEQRANAQILLPVKAADGPDEAIAAIRRATKYRVVVRVSSGRNSELSLVTGSL